MPSLCTPSTEAAFVSFDVDSSWVPVPSLRPYFYGGVPHANVTQHNSTNDAVLKVVLLRRKVHEFLTLLNGTQDCAPHFMKHMLTGCSMNSNVCGTGVEEDVPKNIVIFTYK